MREEAAIYVALIAIGSPEVLVTLIRGDRFGGGTTVCLILVALGLLGLGRLTYEGPLLPRATKVRRRGRRDSR